jgi:predicted nucleic-acid-binding protein
VNVVDTNIVVRVLVADEPIQTRRAQAALGQGDVLILKTVVLESEWVLRSLYRLGPRRIASILRGLFGMPAISVEDAPAVHRALDWLEAGMELADALHLAAPPPGATFLTFDRALIRRAQTLPDAPPVAEPPG